MGVNLDFDMLSKMYFQWDLPVEYALGDGNILNIYPISLKDSELFLACYNLFAIDKNAIPDPEVISMPYLKFLYERLLLGDQNVANRDRMTMLLKMCLKWDGAKIFLDGNGGYKLTDTDEEYNITSKEFDNIRRIILYQNIVDYDDEYINPELKAAMAETDALRSRNITFPNMERKMAIITAHCGLSKKEQQEMTFRAHTLLFREVSGEVDFSASWPIVLYAGETAKHEHWIYKKAKGKYDTYITDTNKLAGDIGVNPNQIKQVSSDNKLDEMYNEFTK